jgi:hypothetical protein
MESRIYMPYKKIDAIKVGQLIAYPDKDNNFHVGKITEIESFGFVMFEDTTTKEKKGRYLSDCFYCMPSVTVCFDNPKYNYCTSLAYTVTEEDAKKYFVGSMHDRGRFPKEDLQTCTKIIFE